MNIILSDVSRYKGSKGTWNISVRQYLKLMELELLKGSNYIINNINPASLKKPINDKEEVPKSLKANLFPYQKIGYLWIKSMLEDNRGCILGEDCLVVLVVLRRDLGLDPFRDRNLTEAEQGFLEFLVRAVVKEAQGAPPGGCVVDDFGHKALIVTEIQLVANPDFPCRIHNHIPQVLPAL